MCIAVAGMGTVGALRLLLLFRGRLPQDVPNERSLHAGSIPRAGGLAMWAGGGAAVGVATLSASADDCLLITGAAAGALALLSYFDDRRGLPVALRMLAHLAAAALVVSALPVSVPLAACLAFVLAWMVNLYNFMDGSDGLAGGMTLVGFATYGIAAMTSNHDLALFSFIVAAAAAGFLASITIPPAHSWAMQDPFHWDSWRAVSAWPGGKPAYGRHGFRRWCFRRSSLTRPLRYRAGSCAGSAFGKRTASTTINGWCAWAGDTAGRPWRNTV